MEEKLELRMYSLVMYNLSPIQQGIQAYHATIEAVNNFGNPNTINEEQFKDWAQNHKTVIILNGGTSSTMNNHHQILWSEQIGHNYFNEPDLNNSMSAISFIVDERVFNKEKYPYRFLGGTKEEGNGIISSLVYMPPESEESYIKRLGGKKNVFLREFLSQFKLA